MSARPKLAPVDPFFTVMATIHGPAGWFDVVDGKTGKTIAVCPKRCFARRIATVLESEIRIDLGPLEQGGRT